MGGIRATVAGNPGERLSLALGLRLQRFGNGEVISLSPFSTFDAVIVETIGGSLLDPARLKQMIFRGKFVTLRNSYRISPRNMIDSQGDLGILSL